MAVRDTIQAGHPALKKRNAELRTFNSLSLKKLLRDMKDTMYDTELIGIAAPQIGQNYMVFITHARNTKARKLGKEDVFRAYINPKIIHQSPATSEIYEGCGSVVRGDLFGPVTRSKEVEIHAYDETGQKFSMTCDGILARIIQHEMDHLNGIEFMEKVNDYRKIIVGDYYRKKVRNSRTQTAPSKITKLEYSELD